MTFFVIGLSHKTAPVELREQFAVNGWDHEANRMHRAPDGRWTASLELHHGHHRYLFLVDGTPTLDPNGSGVTRNDHNERVSLIAVS